MERRSVADARHLCLAVDIPGVVETAGAFAAARARRLVIAGTVDWEAAVRDAITADLRSLTFVVPAWRGDRLDATLLERTLRAVRRAVERSSGVAAPWGILTGADPRSLSLAASEAMAAANAPPPQGPTAIVMSDASWLPAAGELRLPDGVSIGTPATLGGKLLETRWASLCFVGHGRSYCACDGWLCAARSHVGSPHVRLDGCINGYDCVDPDFERVDPRRYDADLMVLDTCGALNLSAATWDGGYAPVALLAAQSRALAVIASDGLTQGGSPSDLVAALAEPTMGGVALRLNALRRGHNLPCAYALLGDPVMPRMPLQSDDMHAASRPRPAPSLALSRGHDAHLPAVVQLTRTVSGGAPGFWPWDLWDAGETTVDAWGVRCPVCGRAVATQRGYTASGDQPRIFTECARCGLVADLPHDSAYGIELAAPQHLAAGRRATVDVRITGLRPAQHIRGGVTVTVSGRFSRVQVTPTIVPIGTLRACAPVTFALHADPTARPHLYYVRAIARVDELWLWASRPLAVTRS
jgi:hypothetical protein